MVVDKPANSIGLQQILLTEVDPTNDDWVLGRLNETQNQQVTLPITNTQIESLVREFVFSCQIVR